MKTALFNNWWLLTIKGCIAILLGVLAFLYPGKTILLLTTYLGIFILFGGVITLLWMLYKFGKRGKGKYLLLLEAIIDIGIGVLILSYPEQTLNVLIYILAFWLIIAGALQVLFSLILKDARNAWWGLLLNGIITILLGILIGYNPFESTIVVTYMLAASATFFGIILVITSLGLRKWGRQLTKKTDENESVNIII